MSLWMTWFGCVWQLQDAVSHVRTFLWMIAVLVGFTIRTDHHGVSSFIRAFGLDARYYECFTDFFHSSAVDLNLLRQKWIELVLRKFRPFAIWVNGRMILVGDGLKNPKEGRRMPGVKLCHQESTNNSKPEYVMAHSCQAIQLLVKSKVGSILSVPLVNQISEGIRSSPRDQHTLHERFLGLLELLKLKGTYYVVLDAYYACQTMANGLVSKGQHLISRVRSNAVAYVELTFEERFYAGKGRPRKYGQKIKLRDVFKVRAKDFTKEKSPLPDESGIEISYLSWDLIWKPIGKLVRFVWVKHPVRGNIILFSTDLNLEPIKILYIYGLRFRIEVSFRQSIHTLGTYAYHFWMKAMDKASRSCDELYLHRKPDDFKDRVYLKLHAFELFIQLGLITQGLAQYIAIRYRTLVWNDGRIWMRTMNPEKTPSEWITLQVLKTQWPEFLKNLPETHIFRKFIQERLKKPPQVRAQIA